MRLKSGRGFRFGEELMKKEIIRCVYGLPEPNLCAPAPLRETIPKLPGVVGLFSPAEAQGRRVPN